MRFDNEFLRESSSVLWGSIKEGTKWCSDCLAVLGVTILLLGKIADKGVSVWFFGERAFGVSLAYRCSPKLKAFLDLLSTDFEPSAELITYSLKSFLSSFCRLCDFSLGVPPGIANTSWEGVSRDYMIVFILLTNSWVELAVWGIVAAAAATGEVGLCILSASSFSITLSTTS